MESHKQIVDQFNNPVSSSNGIAKAAKRTGYAPSHSRADLPFDELFPSRDQVELRSASRTLYTNVSTVHATINQKSSYVVGNGFMPLFDGDDKEWIASAEKWLKKWYKRCNTRGDVFNFRKTLELISCAIDRDGDIFILLTKSKTGYPLIQVIDGSRVGNRGAETQVTKGRFKGAKITSGIIINKYSRPVAYKVLGRDQKGSEDRVIPAASMIHVFDPKWSDQTRGITSLMSAIDTYKNLAKSTEYELLAQAIQGQMAISIESDGKNDISDPYGNTASGEFKTQTIEGGQVRIVDSNGNGKVEMATPSARPSTQYQSFQRQLATEAVSAMGWSINIVLSTQGASSVTRSEIAKAEKSVDARQAILKEVAYKLVAYALSCGIVREDLEPNDHYLDFGFSGTRKISIDLQRDSNARISEYNANLRTLTDLLAEEGKALKTHVTESIEEQALIYLETNRIEKKYGIEGKLDKRTIRMLTPNESSKESA